MSQVNAELAGEKVLNLGADAAVEPAFVARTTDPVLAPTPYASPGDYAGQYPNLIDPTEIIAKCEEISLLQAIPEKRTALNTETWREMSALAFTSGSAYIAFAEGECPDYYEHDGANRYVTLKNIGAKKSLTLSDILDSGAKAALSMGAINNLLGPNAGPGLPGQNTQGSFLQQHVANVKEKEIRLGTTLVMNGWDRLLAVGDAVARPLEFSGIETLVVTGNGAHVNDSTASGTVTAIGFDRFLSESCAAPTHIFGHPTAIQELMSAYFQLGFAGSQVINVPSGDRVVPGFNFASVINTGIGPLTVVSDKNFTRTVSETTMFWSTLYPLAMTHNGEPLVYRITQIPLAWKDLTSGCTTVSFEIWAKTALVIKEYCAQSAYTSRFTGRVVTTCPVIG